MKEVTLKYVTKQKGNATERATTTTPKILNLNPKKFKTPTPPAEPTKNIWSWMRANQYGAKRAKLKINLYNNHYHYNDDDDSDKDDIEK